MAKDWRIDQGGQRLDYTCENARFLTNIKKAGGFPHGTYSTAGGSVTQDALLDGSTGGVRGHSLWLEHVIDKKDPGAEYYWFMWYDPTGKPTIPASGVFSQDDLAELAKRLMRFVP